MLPSAYGHLKELQITATFTQGMLSRKPVPTLNTTETSGRLGTNSFVDWKGAQRIPITRAHRGGTH
jgi:hypothetical protein